MLREFVMLRNSEEPGVVLSIDSEEWQGFLFRIKEGAFNQP